MSLNRFSVFLFILALFCLFGLLIFDSDTISFEGTTHRVFDESYTFLIHGPGDETFFVDVFKTNEIDNWFYFGYWPKSGDHIRVTTFNFWLRWEDPTESSRIFHITYTKKLDTIEYVEPIEASQDGGDNSIYLICSLCPGYDESSSWRR